LAHGTSQPAVSWNGNQCAQPCWPALTKRTTQADKKQNKAKSSVERTADDVAEHVADADPGGVQRVAQLLLLLGRKIHHQRAARAHHCRTVGTARLV
jgi:hypothetical protein